MFPGKKTYRFGIKKVIEEIEPNEELRGLALKNGMLEYDQHKVNTVGPSLENFYSESLNFNHVALNSVITSMILATRIAANEKEQNILEKEIKSIFGYFSSHLLVETSFVSIYIKYISYIFWFII